MNNSFVKGCVGMVLSLAIVFIAGMPLFASAALPGITCGISGNDPVTGQPIRNGNCLIPCNGVDPATGQDDCDFDDFVLLIKNVIYYLIYLSIPLAAVAFVYSGWLFLSAGGNSGQVGKAWEIFRKVAIGLIVILAAWLLVKTITDALIHSQFSPLAVKNLLHYYA